MTPRNPDAVNPGFRKIEDMTILELDKWVKDGNGSRAYMLSVIDFDDMDGFTAFRGNVQQLALSVIRLVSDIDGLDEEIINIKRVLHDADDSESQQ